MFNGKTHPLGWISTINLSTSPLLTPRFLTYRCGWWQHNVPAHYVPISTSSDESHCHNTKKKTTALRCFEQQKHINPKMISIFPKYFFYLWCSFQVQKYVHVRVHLKIVDMFNAQKTHLFWWNVWWSSLNGKLEISKPNSPKTTCEPRKAKEPYDFPLNAACLIMILISFIKKSPQELRIVQSP